MHDDFEAFIAPPKHQYPLLSASFTSLCSEFRVVSLDRIYTHLSLQTQAESFYDLYLLGFAADFGAGNADSRTGAEKAAKLLREQFFTQVTQEPHERLRLWDLGDIDQNQYSNTEDVHQAIQEVVGLISTKMPQSVVVVLGGTDDVALPIIRGCNRLNYIKVDSALDVRERYQKQAYKEAPITFHENHLSYFRQVLEDKQLLSQISHLTFFGLHGQKITQ